MPKEVVQYPATDGISGTEMSVHWSKTGEMHVPIGESNAGNVQLAITNHVWGRLTEPDPRSPRRHSGHADCEACAERAKSMATVGDPPEFGQMVEVDGASVVGEFDPSASIVTKPLTRSEINDLIRVLRRARDQAFGRDE